MADTVSPDLVESAVTCRDCYETFVGLGIMHGDRFVGPTRCQTCEIKNEAPELPGITDVRPFMDALGINMREHGKLTLDDLAADSQEADAARELAGWSGAVRNLKAYNAIEGVYLEGPTGTGKTQLAASTVRHLLEAGFSQRRIVWDRARAFVTTIQDRYGSGTVDPVIDVRRKAGLWVLDDVGTERLKPDSFRIIEDILDRRMGHPTIWTSNLSPEQLSDRWSGQAGHDRFRSRLAGFRFLSITGADRRF